MQTYLVRWSYSIYNIDYKIFLKECSLPNYARENEFFGPFKNMFTYHPNIKEQKLHNTTALKNCIESPLDSHSFHIKGIHEAKVNINVIIGGTEGKIQCTVS